MVSFTLINRLYISVVSLLWDLAAVLLSGQFSGGWWLLLVVVVVVVVLMALNSSDACILPFTAPGVNCSQNGAFCPGSFGSPSKPGFLHKSCLQVVEWEVFFCAMERSWNVKNVNRMPFNDKEGGEAAGRGGRGRWRWLAEYMMRTPFLRCL